MEILSQRLTGRLGVFWSRRLNIGHAVTVFALLLCTIHIPQKGGYGVEAAEVEGKDGGVGVPIPPEIRKNSEEHVPQVRYRSRPVAPFRSSGSKSSNSSQTGNSSSEVDVPEPSGVPFFAVHDLSSQTFDRLQENWRNLEAFIRNLQVRRSQDESQRSSGVSSPISGGGAPPPSSSGSDRDSRRRPPPYSNNNMFTFKYHPVVLEGEGSTSVDDIIAGGNNRGISTGHYGGGNHFNPFAVDAMDQASKNTDMEKHTVATIYTIGICLTIMAIGSVMFILINKCDGTGGSSYIRTIPPTGGRGILAAASRAAGGRQNGRTRSSRRGASATRSSNASGNDQATTSVNNNLASANSMYETDSKVLTDLPPSYDELFPEEGGTALEEVVQSQPKASTSTVVTNSDNESSHVQNDNVTSNPNSTSETTS